MKRIRKAATTLARLAVGLLIIAFLLRKADMESLRAIFIETLDHWPWLAAAALMFFICLVAGSVRWKLILDAQDLRMSGMRVLCICLIGHFFNSFMFGATGGDVARAYYATRETHHKKTEAVATVIIDRVIGMVVLFFIAGIMLVVKLDFFIANPITHMPALLMLAMILAALAGTVFMLNVHRLKGSRLFTRMAGLPKIGTMLNRMAAAFDLYRRKTTALVGTALLSVINHFFIIIMCFCLGRSLSIGIGVLDYLAVIPLIMSISAIPITPGGLGVREGLSVALLGAMGVDSARALSLSLMVYAMMLAWSLVGGLVFICYSASSGHTLHEEMIQLRKEAAVENGKDGIPGAHD